MKNSNNYYEISQKLNIPIEKVHQALNIVDEIETSDEVKKICDSNLYDQQTRAFARSKYEELFVKEIALMTDSSLVMKIYNNNSSSQDNSKITKAAFERLDQLHILDIDRAQTIESIQFIQKCCLSDSKSYKYASEKINILALEKMFKNHSIERLLVFFDLISNDSSQYDSGLKRLFQCCKTDDDFLIILKYTKCNQPQLYNLCCSKRNQFYLDKMFEISTYDQAMDLFVSTPKDVTSRIQIFEKLLSFCTTENQIIDLYKIAPSEETKEKTIKKMFEFTSN